MRLFPLAGGSRFKVWGKLYKDDVRTSWLSYGKEEGNGADEIAIPGDGLDAIR